MITMQNTTQSGTDRQTNEIELVERARRGDRQSLNTLAGMARERLRTYVYRLTQNDDLTQEIVQESLLEMCRILGKLKKTDRFWPWLYGIATNKLHRHYRTERTQRNAAKAEERRRARYDERESGFEGLVGQELKEIVSEAMQKLRTRHKAILVMRCYDGMSYAEIADSMGCTEFSTRMLFVRAKKALQKELLRNGLGKGSLLAALIVFGKMTAPSKAAAAQLTVPAAAMKAGLAAGVAGAATSTSGVVSMAAVGALTVGTVVATSDPGRPVELPAGQHSAVSSVATSPYATPATAHEQFWFYFSEGPQGPMLLRARDGAGESGRRVLQNDYANYEYRNGTVHINNHRMWLDDRVFKLPTDGVQMRAFLAQVEGIRNDVPPVPAAGRGLLVVVERDEEPTAGAPWAIRHSNILDEDFFQSNWPTDARVVDHRDAMHRRGWTYFRVSGNVAGQTVSGVGRLPFVYAASRVQSPWLRLQVGDARTIVDGGAFAVTRDASGAVAGKYPAGSFFKGLPRPWMGLHTLDSIRRDAAEQRASFETRLLDGGERAEVTVTRGDATLVYSIDVEADLVRRIAFLDGQDAVGALEFEYLEDVNVNRREFAAPSVGNERVTLQSNAGIRWLLGLAEGGPESTR